MNRRDFVQNLALAAGAVLLVSKPGAAAPAGEYAPVVWEQDGKNAWQGTAMVYDRTKGKKTPRYVTTVYQFGAGYVAFVHEPCTPVPLPTHREVRVLDHMRWQGIDRVQVCNGTQKNFGTVQEAQEAAESRFYTVYPHLRRKP